MLRNIKSPAVFIAGLFAIYFLAFQLGFSYTNISLFLTKHSTSAKILEFNKPESSEIECNDFTKFDWALPSFMPHFIEFVQEDVHVNPNKFNTHYFKPHSSELYLFLHQWKFHLVLPKI